MTTSQTGASRETWVREAEPARNLSDLIHIVVRETASDDGRAFVWLKPQASDGATVSSAILRVHQAGPVSGTVDVTCRTASEKWTMREMTWQNQPSVRADSVTVSKTDTPSGEIWDFDVTAHMQAVADGGEWWGWRLSTTTTDGEVRFRTQRSAWGAPELIVTWTEPPSKPSTLIPSVGAVSQSHPTLRCDYTDISGDSEMTAIQVQISSDKGSTAADFDSGEVSASVPELDLSDTAFGGLADAESTWWRVRVKDDGGWSQWSDWAALERHVKDSLSITSPSSSTIFEHSPVIGWSFGGTQTHYRLLLWDASNRGRLLYDSRLVASTATSHEIPRRWRGERVITSATDSYTIDLRIHDDVDREATPGDPVATSERRTVMLDYDGTVVATSGLSVTQAPHHAPWLDLVWSRDTFPDTWTIEVNGVAHVVRLDPTETHVNGSTHTYRLWDVDPYREHTIRVRAVVDGKTSSGDPSVTLTPEVKGIWLGDPRTGAEVLLHGTSGVEAGAFGEDAEVFVPLGASAPARITYGMRGLENDLNGLEIHDSAGRAWHEWEADLLSIKARPTETMRLVVADRNIPAVLHSVSIGSHELTAVNGRIYKTVSLGYLQVGELPYSPELA